MARNRKQKNQNYVKEKKTTEKEHTVHTSSSTIETTKMIDTVFLKEAFLKEELLKTFNAPESKTIFLKAFIELEKEVGEVLQSDYIEMQNKLYYSQNVVGCWSNLFSDKQKESFRIDNGNDVTAYKKEIQNYFGKYDFSIPTHKELKDIIYKSSAPWPVYDRGPRVLAHSSVVSDFKGKTQGKTQGKYRYTDSNQSYGFVYPLYRLNGKNSKKLTPQQTILVWLKHKLKPASLKNKLYDLLLAFDFTLEELKLTNIQGDFSKLGSFIDERFLINYFKSKDNIRANILKYDEKIFYDANKGSWELFENVTAKEKEGVVGCKISTPLCARNPEADIVDGIIGIDFGTKSTVVVYSKNKEKILPMRVGMGDWSKRNETRHYENPTVMEFNNLEHFLTNYHASSSRPLTKWRDLTISHTAYESLKSSKSDDFNAYLTELKQWAGDKKRKLKIRDKEHKNVYELHPFLALKEDDINPIELYAYYLGLYINNQVQGIYLDYLLSFPVTYEQAVRTKILESFKRGLQKSLPTLSPKKLNELSVTSGVSEPAAYAAVAMQNYGFDEKEKSFYAIFDFGGGTTDFDYGIFRWSDEESKKERRYDYVIEHFGAGGDKFLGGENILELLAFHVFKANKEALLEQKISFVLPPECDEFLGAEVLLNDSREAKLNMVNLIGVLRPFWERESFKEELFNGKIAVDLFRNDGELQSQVSLKVDEKRLRITLKGRIKKGIDGFFESLREVFVNHADEIDLLDNEVNIFLAGNSSKSPLVKELFDARIKQEEEAMEKDNYKATFKLFAPLDNKDDFEKPNGKTGVAYGLIETRVGGSVLVIDKNIGEKDIKFKYYLGMNRRKKFKLIVSREHPYNEWIEFIDAGEEFFEIYYTSSALATTNSLRIDDSSILRKRLKIKEIDEDKNIYIRFISPTVFEYGVGVDGSVRNSIKVEL
jgi:hypothetical protein